MLLGFSYLPQGPVLWVNLEYSYLTFTNGH